MEDIGFEFWFSIRKEKARLWEIPRHNFCTAIEYIEGLGWIGELEFEGTEPQKAKLAVENALDVLGINVVPFIAGAGVLGVALGFAAKDTLSNLIAGVLLIIDRPFEIGDRIEVWTAPMESAT